jgi:hypothetical protein
LVEVPSFTLQMVITTVSGSPAASSLSERRPSALDLRAEPARSGGGTCRGLTTKAAVGQEFPPVLAARQGISSCSQYAVLLPHTRPRSVRTISRKALLGKRNSSLGDCLENRKSETNTLVQVLSGRGRHMSLLRHRRGGARTREAPAPSPEGLRWRQRGASRDQ